MYSAMDNNGAEAKPEEKPWSPELDAAQADNDLESSDATWLGPDVGLATKTNLERGWRGKTTCTNIGVRDFHRGSRIPPLQFRFDHSFPRRNPPVRAGEWTLESDIQLHLHCDAKALEDTLRPREREGTPPWARLIVSEGLNDAASVALCRLMRVPASSRNNFLAPFQTRRDPNALSRSYIVSDFPPDYEAFSRPFYSIRWPRPVQIRPKEGRVEDQQWERELASSFRTIPYSPTWPHSDGNYGFRGIVCGNMGARAHARGLATAVFEEQIVVFFQRSRAGSPPTAVIVTDFFPHATEGNSIVFIPPVHDVRPFQRPLDRPSHVPTSGLIWQRASSLGPDHLDSSKHIMENVTDMLFSIIRDDTMMLMAEMTMILDLVSFSLFSPHDDEFVAYSPRILRSDQDGTLVMIKNMCASIRETVLRLQGICSVIANAGDDEDVLFRNGFFGHLDYRTPGGHDSGLWGECDALLKRVEILEARVTELSSRIRNMVSDEVSTVTIAEARSVKRITELAFLFIPLSFSTSIYGMDFKELGNNLSISTWIYTAVALLGSAYLVRILSLSNSVQEKARQVSQHVAEDRGPRRDPDGEGWGSSMKASAGVDDYLAYLWERLRYPTIVSYSLLAIVLHAIMVPIISTLPTLPWPAKVVWCLLPTRIFLFDIPLSAFFGPYPWCFYHYRRIKLNIDYSSGGRIIFCCFLSLVVMISPIVVIPSIFTLSPELQNETKVALSLFTAVPGAFMTCHYFLYPGITFRRILQEARRFWH